MIDHYSLTWTILTAGILGGIINFFMVHVKEEEFSDWYIFLKSIFLGLGASTLVPLFLNLIGSNLLEPVTAPAEYPIINYFVIAGFCLAGAIYSKRFIEDIYGRITKAEEEAKDAKKTAEEAKRTSKELEQSVTEPDESPGAVGQEMLQVDPLDEKSIKIQSILKALLDSRYIYRTISGVAKETGIEKSVLKKYLDEMQESGLVTARINRSGNLVFKPVR